MIFLERTSVGLFLRPTTYSFQNRPWNHSSNVGTSFSTGGVATPVASANAFLIARCSASRAPILVAARS